MKLQKQSKYREAHKDERAKNMKEYKEKNKIPTPCDICSRVVDKIGMCKHKKTSCCQAVLLLNHIYSNNGGFTI